MLRFKTLYFPKHFTLRFIKKNMCYHICKHYSIKNIIHIHIFKCNLLHCRFLCKEYNKRPIFIKSAFF